MSYSSSFLLSNSIAQVQAQNFASVALETAASEPDAFLSAEASEALVHVGVVLTASVVVAGIILGIQRLRQRPGSQNESNNELRIRRVEDFDEMQRFLSLTINGPGLPDRIKIRSFKGMTADHRYRHVMATRGPGIAMTSTSFGWRFPRELPRSPEEVAGYSLQLYVGDLAVDETLPASSGPNIKKLHLGAAKVFQDTGSIQKTSRWLKAAVEKIQSSL